MEPLVPDWRTLGGGSNAGPTAGAAPVPHQPAHRTVVLTPRVLTWLIGGLLAAALTGGAAFLSLAPTTGGVVVETDGGYPAATSASVQTDTAADLSRVASRSADLVVDVEGAVPHPGLVHVPAGGRVGDALTRAGGFAANADLTRTASDLNLAQPVTDGLKVVVPTIGQASTDTSTADAGVRASAATGLSGLVDLNRANETELDTLPGVGPATIAKIVAARESAPFASTEDLRSRKIIGDAAFEQLKSLVTVGR